MLALSCYKNEVIRKTGVLAKILAGKDLHLEETVPVKVETKILYDHSIEGTETNMTHVSYKYTTVLTQESKSLES